MRTIDLVRHTDNDGDVLSPEGIEAAVALGGQLSGPYRLAVSTGAQRSTQTVACLLAGLGEVLPDGVVVEEGLRSDREDEWREAYQEAGSGELASFRRVAPDLVASEKKILGQALARVFDRLADGDQALVVGHSPTNEAAVLGLTDTEIAPLDKGARVRITEDEGVYRVEPRG